MAARPFCGGKALAGHEMPTKPLYHSSPQQDEGEENKMEKTPMG